MDDHSVLRLSPLLAAGGFRAIPSFVVLVRHVVPVSGKNCSAAGLEALHHGPTFFLIAVLVNLLEEERASVNAVVFVVVEDVALDLLVELVPVVLDLGAGRVVELTLLHAFRNSQAVSPQEAPVFTGDLLLHDDFDGVELDVVLGTHSIDLLEENEVEFVVAAVLGNGELDAGSILLELDLEVFLLLDGEGDLDAHFCWGLIPGVLVTLRVPQNLVLQHVLLSHLDYRPLVQRCLLCLLHSLNQVNTHQQELYLISDAYFKTTQYLQPQYVYRHRCLQRKKHALDGIFGGIVDSIGRWESGNEVTYKLRSVKYHEFFKHSHFIRVWRWAVLTQLSRNDLSAY